MVSLLAMYMLLAYCYKAVQLASHMEGFGLLVTRFQFYEFFWQDIVVNSLRSQVMSGWILELQQTW